MKILVTGAWNCTEEQLNRIREIGHTVIFQQMESDPLVCGADDVEGVICNGLFLYHPIEDFIKLKYIQLTSAGYDRIPMDYVNKHNIEIYNARGVYSIPMAEYAIAGVLQLYKQSKFFYENQSIKKWEKHRGLLELEGKKIGIVGCGSVGTECAKRFKIFGCKIIGVDLYINQNEYFSNIFEINRLNEVLEVCDVVILTLPLTDKTRYMINKERLSFMKKGAILVNIARGALVDEVELIEALKTRLGGAVLDVFENEPLEYESEIWNMNNVIVTPHNSFIGDGNNKRLEEVIIRNLEA